MEDTSYANGDRAVPAMTGHVTATAGLRVRAKPNTTSQIVAVLPHGTEVNILATIGEWYRIDNGYVFAEYVSLDAPDPHFERAIAFVLRWEGGYSTDRNDAGNWTGGAVGKGILKGTNRGISAASYPNLDIRNLTLEQTKKIYFNDYWVRGGADKLTWPLNIIHFDACVQHGLTSPKAWLADSKGEPLHYLALRMDFYTKIKTWNLYGLAWMRRMSSLMLEGDGR